MSQRFPESNERVTPYYLCRLRKPWFTHIPNDGSKVPSFEWPSVQRMSCHFHSHSRKPSAAKSANFVPTPAVATVSPPAPKGRNRKGFKGRSGSSQPRSSSNASSDSSPLSHITPSSLGTSVQIFGPMQIPVSDQGPPLARMFILEIVARDAASLSKLPDQRLKHGLAHVADAPAPAAHSSSLFSHRFSSPQNATGREAGEVPRGLRQSVDELSSTAHSQSLSSCTKRKRKRQDSDAPTAPVRVSKRTRVPTARAQVVPPAPAKKQSRRKAQNRTSLSEPKTAETSLVSSLSPSVCSISATQPRRSKRKRTAMDHGEAETLPLSVNVDASAGTRKRRKTRSIK